MSEPSGKAPTGHSDRWVSLGIGVSAVSAGFSSFAGLKSLAEATGWGGMAPLFALCVDAYALTAIRVWLASSTASRHARSFAKWNAIGAILLSLAGNAAWHLIAAGLLDVTWHVVMAVGAVPPVILGLTSHLAVIRRQVDPPVAQPTSEPANAGPPVPRTVPGTVLDDPSEGNQDERPKALVQRRRRSGSRQDRPRFATEDELMIAARQADVVYREKHDGKAITRDELRRALRIGGDRATALLRRLRAKSAGEEAPSIPQHPAS